MRCLPIDAFELFDKMEFGEIGLVGDSVKVDWLGIMGVDEKLCLDQSPVQIHLWIGLTRHPTMYGIFYLYSITTEMQEEIAKHTKKLYRAMKNPEHGFWEKLREVAIEIFIIVFAVTLSIGLHSWSDHRHEQAETNEFLRGLKDDLSKDIRLIDENKQTIAQVDSRFHFLMALYNNPRIDTVDEHRVANHFSFDQCTTHPNIGRYEGFKSSGKMGTIENDSLKQNILAYYQQTMPALNDIENMANSFQTRIADMQIDQLDKTSARALVKTKKMQALLQFATENLDDVIRQYDSTGRQAKKIILIIDRQTGHD